MKARDVITWAVACVLAIVLFGFIAAKAEAQELKDLTPRLIHGPLVGVTTVSQGDDERYHANVFGGLGYKAGVSLVDAQDHSWLAVGVPAIMAANSEADEFKYAMGLDATFAGNFGIGAVIDFIKTGGEKDSGLLTGYSDKKNITFLVSFTLPLGGGGVVNGYR